MNEYIPPSSELASTNNDPDNSRSLSVKTIIWSVFWRYAVGNFLSMMLVGALYIRLFDFSDINMVQLKPTFLSIGHAFNFAIFSIFYRNGLVHIFGGAKLHLTSRFWRRFNWLMIIYFLLVAIINLIVVKAVDEVSWVYIKVYGYTLIGLLFPIFSIAICHKVKT